MASGRVVTWLKASAVARILIRIVFMNRRVSECRPGFVRTELYKKAVWKEGTTKFLANI